MAAGVTVSVWRGLGTRVRG